MLNLWRGGGERSSPRPCIHPRTLSSHRTVCSQLCTFLLFCFPCHYYFNNNSKWQVSTNGLLSFENPLNAYETCNFPCTPEPVIAPLWTDLNFNSRGLIYYRTSQDPDVLNQVVDMIAAMDPGLSDYQPTLAVVATWFDATTRYDKSVNCYSKIIMSVCITLLLMTVPRKFPTCHIH